MESLCEFCVHITVIILPTACHYLSFLSKTARTITTTITAAAAAAAAAKTATKILRHNPLMTDEVPVSSYKRLHEQRCPFAGRLIRCRRQRAAPPARRAKFNYSRSVVHVAKVILHVSQSSRVVAAADRGHQSL